MARKYDLISELYEKTAQEVVSSPQYWEVFLRSACRNYKLRFDEQLLVFAQRPDATAVLEIERWNNMFGRWVNRGAKGIAVFEDADRSRQRLTHYFDISDTHESRYSRPVPLWRMREEYIGEVVDTLEGSFGELEDKSALWTAIYSAAKNATEDNLPDYLEDFLSIAENTDSFTDCDEAKTVFQNLVQNSTAYMLLSRSEVIPTVVLKADCFNGIERFNDPQLLNCLGVATSDISEMMLTEIARTVTTLERQNRIIVETGVNQYNGDRNQSERSLENDRTDLHEARRLRAAEPDAAGAAGGDAGQIRTDEAEVSEGEPQDRVLQSPDELQNDRASGTSRTESDRNGGISRDADGENRGRDREAESDRHDGLGASDERHSKQSSGDRSGGGNLRLGWYDRENEDKSLPFFGKTEDINEILLTTPHLKASKDEIRAFYESYPDDDARTEFIKGIFNDDFTEVILRDGRRVGYKTWENVLQFWEGSYLSRTAQSFYNWSVIAAHFEGLRLLGELHDNAKPLPSMDGQLTLIEDLAEEKPSAFVFSQEIIDAVLTRGSGFDEGKFRIYRQFEQSLSAKENADFLKHEYGIGGVYPAITGAEIDESHDGKGIRLSRNVGDEKYHIDLNWNQVEKRIAELIRLDRYLSPKEKAYYPEWLQKEEDRRAQREQERQNREILSTAPNERADISEEKPAEKETPQSSARYEYHLGDTVTIGAQDFEILSFDENRVLLYDPQFPLFQKEMPRDEFDRKVQENPMNDHLKVQEAVNLDHTATRIVVDNQDETVSWMYLNTDADSGAQYVSCEISFDSFKELVEQHDIANHPENAGQFLSDLEEMADQTLSDIRTPFFLEAQADYEGEADFVEFTPENILQIHERILSYEADREAERDIDRGEAEFGADGTRVFRDTDEAEPTVRFDSIEFEKLIPHEMRFKEADLVNGNEMFWVTQELFTIEQLREFQQAVRTYDSDVKKFYVTPRDLSGYNFEEDLARNVLAVVTPDTMLKDDYVRAMQEVGLGDYLAQETPAEPPTYDIGMGYLGNGLTVWNRAVKVDGDYQTIAHISPEGEISYRVSGLPAEVVERIEQAAETERQNARFTASYREYAEIKHDNPDGIVLFQVDDFFEMYGADAELAAEALELRLTSRAVNANERVPMCGIPAHRLQTYTDMLRDRGHDVVLASLEDGQREVRMLQSDRKENPVESFPVGRIDYLGTDGRVGESVEYTSAYQFEHDIKEENYFGAPMTIIVYRDADGNTIPHDFIAQLDPPPQGFRVEDRPQAEKIYDLDYAKELIDDFLLREYGQEEHTDYTDLSDIKIAYTTTEDEQHEIQVSANLIDFRLITKVDEKVVRTEQYEDLRDFTENCLANLTFDELVYASDEELLQIQPTIEPMQPSFIQPKSKVQSFDLHPEIPMSERHNFDLANNEVEEVNKKERFHRNYAAITVLKRCQQENRFATPDEQKILSRYVGWGGIPEAFDERAGAWQTEYAMLKNILTPEEYDSAKASTLTAFFTPPVVIKAIYKTLEQLGFREGNLLEPSCGIGNFIGLLPETMQNSSVYGVEIDTISAGIAAQLYQKTSIAAQPFEEAVLPDSFFDGVIGNVPFGDIRVNDRRYNKQNFLIHDYFFAKCLDKLRPGGVMALVTSRGTMDKESPAVRKYIAQRADLLGAIRLPNNTFQGNAGTEVVSDILILQKRDRLIDIEPDWVHLDTDENGIKMNRYFVSHPEMVLGEMKMVSGRFGMEPTCEPYAGADLSEQLTEAISNIHGEISAFEAEEELGEEDNSIPADPTVRNFSYTVVDDKIYYRENSRMNPVEVSATAENRIKGLIGIRGTVRRLIEIQTEDWPDENIQAEQEKLNQLYDAFTAKYGLINSRANTSVFSQDSSYFLLSALEVIDENGNLERKADMFTKRTIKPHTPVTSVDTASEAFALSMGEKACVDMAYMQQLTGKSEQEIYEDLKGVIFLNPLFEYGGLTDSKYLPADEYLSGNVREKLAVAKRSAELYPEDYTVNVDALERVQPKDLTASEISVQLGSVWVPEEIVERFIFDFLDTPRYAQWNIKVHFSKFTGEWNIENKSYDRGNLKAYSTYGTSRINAYKIIEETLNLKDVRIFDYVEDAEGKKKAVLNTKETEIAQAKQELIKQGFKDWIWSNPTRRANLCRLYNDRFNSLRPREYDGSHIQFDGMNPEIELREHQRNAVAHILYGGNTLLAHAVGAGKTYEMAAAAMEMKRLGLCQKSLFVVPNHLTEQWASEFLQLYPAANILVATKKDFETKNRKRFCGRIATGDYDAIIIGHSQFEKIPMSIGRQREILELQLNEIVDGIRELKEHRGDRFSVKQLEKTKKSLLVKLEKLNDQSRKDDVVTFEELGIDRLFIDESHYYKNLFLYTKMRNVSGIAQTEAQKSSDLFMKCRYLDELTGGRGTVFATGTPISNSMVELYTIQRYLQYGTLQQTGLQHFDSWASVYGEAITGIELRPEGTGYRAKTRFARFNNIPELMSMFKLVADIQTADMLNLPVPKANYHNVATKPSEIQREMVAELAKRAEKVRNGMVNASVDNMLLITNDGRKLALDQRLANDMLPDYEGSKINACVDNVFRIWENGKEKRLAQLVFCDLSTPKDDGSFSVYNDIRSKLIERGVPAEEIRFIHEADTEAKKLELFKKTRKGDVRILMGSTQKMGAGTNVQDRLIALHDLDCPWRPSDLEQRSGRIIRQGNGNPEVEIYRYVTEDTFDAYLYQLVENKQKFASQIMTSKSPVRSADDIDETALSYAEIKMLATGNPYIKEKMDLDVQVSKLKLLKSNYLSEKYALEDKILKTYPQEIARKTEIGNGLEADIRTAQANPKGSADDFCGMTVKGKSYAEKAKAGEAILAACKEMTSPDPVPLGEYRGFAMELAFDTFSRTYQVRMKGELTYSVELGTDTFGNITRLDNVLEGLPKRLEQTQAELENTKQQLETAKVEVTKPFAKEEELTQKTARLNELNALLSLDKHENEIVGGDLEEGEDDSLERPCSTSMER